MNSAQFARVGEKPHEVQINDNYISLFGEIVSPEWATLRIVCPETGKNLFDSGKIIRTDAFCVQNGVRVFVFDGNVHKRKTDNCYSPPL
jgi:hypothetical protein